MLPVVQKCKITTAHDNLRTSQESGGILRREGKWISWEQYLSGENVGIMVTAHSGTVQRVRWYGLYCEADGWTWVIGWEGDEETLHSRLCNFNCHSDYFKVVRWFARMCFTKFKMSWMNWLELCTKGWGQQRGEAIFLTPTKSCELKNTRWQSS